MVSATAMPKGRCRAFSSRPANTAAIGLPAAIRPTARNCAPPANTTVDIRNGTQVGNPYAMVIAPNDAPTATIAAAIAAASRNSPVSVRCAVRMV
jgi:hypothetical protein